MIHNELLLEHNVGVLGRIREPRPAPLFSSTPLRIGSAAPSRGQHTRDSLREYAGMTDEEVNALSAAGVFGDHDV